MKNEIVPLLKSVAVVVVGVLIANYVQTTLLASKVTKPADAPKA
jgi:hypothetical protein